MPTYQFEAMDATGNEIKDVVEASNEEEAQATLRQMGYFITKLSVKKSRSADGEKKKGKGRKTFALGRVNSKVLTTFTRQLSILQDAGLPILRSLRIGDAGQAGRPENSLIDVCEEIEGGATCPKPWPKPAAATPAAAVANPLRFIVSRSSPFSRLYVNMIKAGEAGGALEVILQRLAEFQERAQSLKRKVRRLGLPDLRGRLRLLDPGVHHVEDRAAVQEDLRRLRHQAPVITEYLITA